jgi:hypothetical protein
MEFIETLEGLPADEKKRMKELTPQTYTGLASTLAKDVNKY